MRNKVLHLVIPDNKFTIPLIHHLMVNLKLDNHRFIIYDFKENSQLEKYNASHIFLPNKRYFIRNIFIFYREVFKADVIISHAAPLFYMFIFIPLKIRKVIWIFHGGIDIPSTKISKINSLISLNLMFKRAISKHSGHMKEDSDKINKVLNSKAIFIYNPAYLSNTWNRMKSSEKFIYCNGFKNCRVIVGSSTDPQNNHIDAYNILANSQLLPSEVCSFLSYGNYNSYRDHVIQIGFLIFKQNFNPVTSFMDLNIYLDYIDEFDFVIFNHERAEATGAAIQLLSLGKPIFFNPKSPAYQSFVRRGYVVFDIYKLSDFISVQEVDLRKNRELLLRDYSIEALNNFYTNL